jgi:hypothetical protein
MGFGHYKLDRLGQPQLCDDLLEFARWFETFDRKLAHTEFPDGTYVSTVFLGLDHNWSDGPPILWETMIFSNSDFAKQFDGEQRRYSSREAALVGHNQLCNMLSVGLAVN